jgi:hypothetical protein
MTDPPKPTKPLLPNKPRFFFKGFPEDVRFRAHTVPEALEIAKGTLYEAWFTALQLSPYLAQAIDSGQWPSLAAQETHELFGDLRTTTFDAWWVACGHALFAEQRAFRRVCVNEPTQGQQPSASGSAASISLEIPLDVSPVTLKRQFDQLLREHHPHYRDFDRWRASTAPVRLENRKLTSVSINLYLEVYRCWLAKGGFSGQEVRLYEIGEELRLDPKNTVLRSDPPRFASAKHLKMSLLVSDYLEKAKNLVAHATEGRFPCTDDHPWVPRRTRAARTPNAGDTD